MKKLIMSLTALFALSVGAVAQQVTVADVEALSGETVSLAIKLNTNGGSYTGLEFDIQFPCEGFTTTGKATMTNTGWDGAFTIGDIGGVSMSNLARCGVLSYSDTAIPGEGLQPLGNVEFTVGTGVALGSYTVTLTNMTLIGEGRVPVADATFTLSVVNTHTVVLDETSTTAPEATAGVNVNVKRTIKAGEWSTICLPFSMTEAQVKEAFGSDVQLADFISWSSEEDDDGNIVGIRIGFTYVTKMEANHPYIIKVTEAISEFTVDGVDLEVEEQPTVQVGKKKSERGYFTGCYVANTVVPEDNLFLDGNKFWYSKGQTKMRAFRGYFELADVLTEVEEADSRITFLFYGTTGMDDIRCKKEDAKGEVYDLQGRKVLKPVKGLYIKNGRKEVNR